MDWISSLLLATVRLAIPVLLISLAELYGQRAGMVNIGLEGLASIGALVGFLVCYVTGSNWLGLLCGALAGVIVNMIYAFSTVTLCADHTVYGMALNIFAPALASFIYRVYFGTGSDLKQITTMSSVAIPGLKRHPGARAAALRPEPDGLSHIPARPLHGHLLRQDPRGPEL
ncbi:MAG: ABC transporter permease subunit [Acutalibacteraceae bacterium]